MLISAERGCGMTEGRAEEAKAEGGYRGETPISLYSLLGTIFQISKYYMKDLENWEISTALPRKFTKYENFQIAFLRVARGGNKEYKNFYRHLFPSYNLALKENLNDLIEDVKKKSYEPAAPTTVYLPKKSGILRPITLLSIRDLIIYQAILNIIAEKFQDQQNKYAFKKSFGNICAGVQSPFFFRSWKVCYNEYNKAISKAFNSGNVYVADFDLVSFYDLIDHNLLREYLNKKVKNKEILDLLFCCLSYWATRKTGACIRHGVPQGPEPSSFLAECLLFHIDAKKFKNVKYLRYSDDIKLMAKDRIPLRRALLRLDLESKELGLVPQAQKIDVKKADSLEEVLKTIPSPIASEKVKPKALFYSQKELSQMFRNSIIKKNKEWVIDDITKFKFSLFQLNPRKDILNRIRPMLIKRPDCSSVLSVYLKKFPKKRETADMLLEALRQDPTYDAAAADYISALDVCEPETDCTKYRRVIQTAKRRSEEQSILLNIASLTFRGRRCGPRDAIKLIKNEKSPIVRGILIHRLFGEDPDAPYKIQYCKDLLKIEINGDNTDLARFCALLMILNWPWSGKGSLYPGSKSNHSAKLLMKGLGIRSRIPTKKSVLEIFFEDKMGIAISIPWRKALGKDFRNAENKCIRFQKFEVGDPSARIMLLDTFNEILLQNFSESHSSLSAEYIRVAGRSPPPDIGRWLRNQELVRVIPNAILWFQNVHDTRKASDMAHAKLRGSGRRGKPTKPIAFNKADSLMKKAPNAWKELFTEWKNIL